MYGMNATNFYFSKNTYLIYAQSIYIYIYNLHHTYTQYIENIQYIMWDSLLLL